MKKILVPLVCLMMLSSVAFASPLMDYSKGKGSIDLTWRNTETTLSAEGQSVDLNKKNNIDASITFGLGNNFAIQHRYFHPKSAFTASPNNPNQGISTELVLNEYNLLYKLNKNVSLFTGLANTNCNAWDGSNQQASSKTKNIWQVGIIASTVVADKTTLWGSVATGNNLTNYEIGIGYEFNPGWELNVNYRDLTVKDVRFGGNPGEFKEKGMGFGITHKF